MFQKSIFVAWREKIDASFTNELDIFICYDDNDLGITKGMALVVPMEVTTETCSKKYYVYAW